MTIKSNKRCGTCKHWNSGSDESGYDSYCGWPHPDLPFWASINNGDHGDLVSADQGTRCKVWEIKDAN